ncbi:MAG TPA: non-canonical purine NTP pyrophosphatase [Longimicrobiales bacterium]|nr:non-canonical purine NTP pyrophosphatase [Longimicrobiales bacterium]
MAADTIVLATRSADKLREIRQILAPVFHGNILTLDETGIQPSPAEDGIECFDSFVANARAKAAWFLRATRLPTLADDSGICVDALGGNPGVRSRRYAEAGCEGAAQDLANNQRLLHELRDVPRDARTAHYTCAAVLLLPDGRCVSSLGTCSGFILESPRGDGGFGYDPLFLDAELNASFAELPPAVKNRRSHRARAFRALAANLPR